MPFDCSTVWNTLEFEFVNFNSLAHSQQADANGVQIPDNFHPKGDNWSPNIPTEPHQGPIYLLLASLGICWCFSSNFHPQQPSHAVLKTWPTQGWTVEGGEILHVSPNNMSLAYFRTSTGNTLTSQRTTGLSGSWPWRSGKGYQRAGL
jgi:hypothetical protein